MSTWSIFIQAKYYSTSDDMFKEMLRLLKPDQNAGSFQHIKLYFCIHEDSVIKQFYQMN